MANLYSSDDTGDKFKLHSGFSITITTSIASPTATPGGITWDDTDFFSTSYGATDKIYRHTGFSTTIAASIAAPAATAVGLTCDAAPIGNIISGNQADDKIRKHSGFSVTITDSFVGGTGNETSDVTFDGSGNVYGIRFAGGAGKSVKYTGFSATVSSSFAGPANASGCTWDGTNFYATDLAGGAGTCKKYTGFTSTVNASINVAANTRSIAWDDAAARLAGGATPAALHFLLMGV